MGYVPSSTNTRIYEDYGDPPNPIHIIYAIPSTEILITILGGIDWGSQFNQPCVINQMVR